MISINYLFIYSIIIKLSSSKSNDYDYDNLIKNDIISL